MGIDWIRHANAVWKCTSISVLEMSALIKWRPVCRWLWVRLCQCASHISHRALALYFTPIAQSCMSRWFYFNRFQQIRLSAVITNEYGSLGFIFPVTCCWRAGYWCCVSKHSNRCNAIQYDRAFFSLSSFRFGICLFSEFIFNQMRLVSSCVHQALGDDTTQIIKKNCLRHFSMHSVYIFRCVNKKWD